MSNNYESDYFYNNFFQPEPKFMGLDKLGAPLHEGDEVWKYGGGHIAVKGKAISRQKMAELLGLERIIL